MRGVTAETVVEQRSQFQFNKSSHIPELTVLQAAMSDFRYDRHAHEEHAFGVTLSGRQDFFSGGHFHRSPPGHIIHFHAGDVHDGESGGADPLNYVMVYIHPDRLDPLLAEAAGQAHSGSLRLRETLLADAPLRQVILQLAELVNAGGGSQLDQEHALYQLAARVAQRLGRYQANAVSPRVDTLLLRARDYIHAHLDDDLALEDISEAVHLSKYHFLRLFRRQFGITPHQYVLNCRINAARNDLEAGQAANEVAFRYGFADLSHLNRRFKRIYGMTPRQYQASVCA